jgi:hypothetical protein
MRRPRWPWRTRRMRRPRWLRPTRRLRLPRRLRMPRRPHHRNRLRRRSPMKDPRKHPAARSWTSRANTSARDRPIYHALRAHLHRAFVHRNRRAVLEAVVVGLRRQARGQMSTQRRACHLRLRNGAVIGEVVCERLVQARAGACACHKSYLRHQHRAGKSDTRNDQPSSCNRPAQLHDPHTVRTGRRFPCLHT